MQYNDFLSLNTILTFIELCNICNMMPSLPWISYSPALNFAIYVIKWPTFLEYHTHIEIWNIRNIMNFPSLFTMLTYIELCSICNILVFPPWITHSPMLNFATYAIWLSFPEYLSLLHCTWQYIIYINFHSINTIVNYTEHCNIRNIRLYFSEYHTHWKIMNDNNF